MIWRNPTTQQGSVTRAKASASLIGQVVMWAGDSGTIPQGWLLCDGSDVARSTYPGLFEAIGETFGAGDGSTTFTLPDLAVVELVDIHFLIRAERP